MIMHFNSRKTLGGLLALGLGLSLIFSSCKKDEPSLGEPPSSSDAAFTYSPSADNPNIIEFKANNTSLTAQWDFGNGTTGEGSEVSATYPNAGTYTVKLTVFNSGGSASSSQDITIAQDDPSLLNNPLYTLLTGGPDGPGSKTWVIDSTRAGHFGVGPNPSQAGNFPEWYAATALEKTTSGMYDDKYVFSLSGFGFDMITNGSVYINAAHTGDWPNAVATNVNDYKSPFPDQMGETWNLVEGNDTTISVSGDAFLAYYTGVQTYQIINIEENELFLRFEDTQDPGLAWYIRLIPEGYVPGGGGDPVVPKYSLPLDFETVQPDMTTFGNSTVAYIANPDPSGINTSANVLETVHGNETWAGFFVNLEDPLDFSVDNNIKLKVWAPITGDFRLKLEEQGNTNNFVEVDVTVNTANTWQELTFDMTGVPADFDRIVFFPGWNVANAGTFYLDDVVQD